MKSLSEIYGFKSRTKKLTPTALRRIILKETRRLLEQEATEAEAEVSGKFTGEYSGDPVDKSTNVKDVDAVEIANQLLSGDDDAPIVKATQGNWFATSGAQAKEWIEKIGPETFVSRLSTLASKVPATGLPKSVMPFLPGPEDAQGSFGDVEDALTPGGKYNIDTHEETATEEKAEDAKEAIIRGAEYLLFEKTAPPSPNTFVGMDDAAKEFMTAGLKDGDDSDDQITITKGGSVPASEAIPTQSNILIYKALGMAMNPKNQIAGGPLDAWAGTGGEILDGHHRWAATMFNDPGASLGTAGQVDLQALGDEKETLMYLTALGNALGNATKTESKSTGGKLVMERWRRLAGIL